MKLGDKLKCIDPTYKDFLASSTTLTVSAILDKEKDEEPYLIHLDEFGDFIFPETSFEILTEGELHLELNFIEPKSPEQQVFDELKAWRDKLIQAENNEDLHDAERCWKFIDFFLDKLLTIKEYEKEVKDGI